MLSQCTKADARRSDPTMLNRTYQALGLMSHSGMDFFDETEELKTYSKGPRRYTFEDPDATILEGIQFFRNMITSMCNGRFKHYEIPGKENKMAMKKLKLNSMQAS